MNRLEELRGKFEKKYSTELWCLRTMGSDTPPVGLNNEGAALYWLQVTSQNIRRASVVRLYYASPDQRINIRAKQAIESVSEQREREELPF